MIYIPVNPLYFKFGIHDDAIDKIEEEIAPFFKYIRYGFIFIYWG